MSAIANTRTGYCGTFQFFRLLQHSLFPIQLRGIVMSWHRREEEEKSSANSDNQEVGITRLLISLYIKMKNNLFYSQRSRFISRYSNMCIYPFMFHVRLDAGRPKETASIVWS